jgi:antibiotic biosynthesis monooxygenase (ABM) superfamily enzyme
MVSTGLITAAMTWVVMPTLVPFFAGWLYPASAETAAPAQPPSEDS